MTNLCKVLLQSNLEDFFITPTPQNISYFHNELFKVNCRIHFIGLKFLGSILSAALR